MREGLTSKRDVWVRRARNTAIGFAIVVAVVGIFGFFIAPGIVKSVAETQIAAQLGRKATIGRVRLNPYRLAATVEDFTLYEADGRTVAAHVDALTADISSASLFKRALVLDAFKVVKPTLSIARLDAGRYDFSDIVDKLASQPKSEPIRFSINNIEIDDGTIDIDDRVGGRKHRIDGLRVALPFLSNLPYDTAVFVTPAFAARVDGSPIALTGKAQPFSASREAVLELDVSDLDPTEYIGLSPVKLPFRLASGKLAAKLSLVFAATTQDAGGKTVPQSMTIAGHVGASGVDLTDLAGHSAIRAKTIDVDLAKLDPLSGDVAIDRIAVVEPQVDATRRADGSIDLVDLFRMPRSAGDDAAPPARGAERTPLFTIATLKLESGSVRFVDQALPTPVTTSLRNVDFDAGAIAMHGTTPTTYKLTLAADDDATLELQGSAVVEKRTAAGSVSVKQLRPARLGPYFASMLKARIDDGRIDFGARYRIDASAAAPTGVVDQIALHVERLRTSFADDKAALLAADGVALEGGSFDLATRAFAADAVKLTVPVIAIKRDAKGIINLSAALIDAKPATSVPVAPGAGDRKGVAVTVQPAAAQAFTAVVKSFEIERGDVSVEDLAVGTPVRIRVQPLNLKAQNVGTAADAVVPFELDASIERGRLVVKGKVAVAPLAVDASVDAKQVPVGWLAAYAGDQLNIVVASADLDTKGTVRVARGKPTAAEPAGPLDVAYRGSLGIVRMRALDRATSEEFVQWKTLDIPKVDLQMPAKNAPFALTLGAVALSDFYARVIINANGRLNLQDVVAAPGQRQSVTTPDAPSTPVAPSAGGAPRKTVATAAPPSTSSPSIHVDGIRLSGGRVGITDNFIKPNYSANLTDLAGDVSTIASGDPKPSDVKLTGRIDGDGALDVTGAVNLLAPLKFTDLSAVAKDIELTRLTPYAIKYAGYAIDRGKLSMTVKYHIDDGKLDAQNRLFLDQLTFGAKVESATATKLPVLLAVSLLKNSRGEIDINLPISGSLSDPEFSVGGVIARVLVNLLTRAITSPFALLGSALGGGGGAANELGYVQFQPGVSEMTTQGKAKLETLAKALADRPALKLDIIGRFDPATDVDGLKRDHLLDRLKDLKAKEVSKGGEHVGRDGVKIEANEYATWLARVYDDTKLPDKPRNAIGLAKTIPVEEMERLLLADIKLDASDPRWLAEARADVVRHDIEDTGKVAASRVFLVTPKLDARGIEDKGAASRVDFALR